MAERSNAHDSKSCDAGMYPRVQIPFSAPQKEIDTVVYLFLYFRVSNIPEDGAKIQSGACDSDQLLPPQTEPLET